MGIVRFEEVTEWQRAALKEARVLAADADEAGPIGKRASSPISHTATWIRLDSATNKLVYGPEIDIEVYRGHEKLLPTALQQKLGMRDLRGWLFQVRESGPNSNPRSFALLDGKEILLSKLPHSRNYFVRRTLKPCKHEKSVWSQVERAWDRHPEIPLSDERLDRILQEMSVTPFVSMKGCRAAWAIAPERFEVLGSERFDYLDDYTIAALEIPFERASKVLISDSKIQHALDLTDGGSLFHRYRAADFVRAAIRHRLGGGKGPVRTQVTEGLYENRHKLMRAAICAALCGREVRSAGDSVTDSALLLYHRFAYNFVGREERPVTRPWRDAKTPDDFEAPQPQGPAWSVAFEEDERTREFTVEWRELGEEAAKTQVMRLVNHVLEAPNDSMDEDFVGTLRPALAGWPAGWNKPENFDKAMQRLNDAARTDVRSTP